MRYRIHSDRAGLMCGFYLNLFENTLLYCTSPSSVRRIRSRPYSINTPKKMYQIQRISPVIKIFTFIANGNTPKRATFV